jgi:NADH-quinone oxidoreductase subunit E
VVQLSVESSISKQRDRESLMDGILENYNDYSRNIINILLRIQEKQGFVSEQDAIQLSNKTHIPLAKIFSILSFYNYFSFKRAGKNLLLLCDGTACRVQGNRKLRQTLKDELDISPGETTKDNLFTLKEVRCLGACALAPVMMVNGKIYGNLDEKKVKEIISGLKQESGKKES